MDWFLCAQNDWSVYQDATRIHKFVEFGKITPEQYYKLTDLAYE